MIALPATTLPPVGCASVAYTYTDLGQQKTIADLQSQVATLTAEQKEIADLKAQFEALKKSVSK